MGAVCRHHVHSVVPCPVVTSSSSRNRRCGYWRCGIAGRTTSDRRLAASRRAVLCHCQRSSAHEQRADDHHFQRGHRIPPTLGPAAPRGGKEALRAAALICRYVFSAPNIWLRSHIMAPKPRLTVLRNSRARSAALGRQGSVHRLVLRKPVGCTHAVPARLALHNRRAEP
jgi:hypothetical protein